MMTHAYKSKLLKQENASGQPSYRSEFQASLSCSIRPCLKKQKQIQN